MDALLQSEEVADVVRIFSHEAVTTVARAVLGKAREMIKNTGSAPTIESMVSEIVKGAESACKGSNCMAFAMVFECQ